MYHSHTSNNQTTKQTANSKQTDRASQRPPQTKALNSSPHQTTPQNSLPATHSTSSTPNPQSPHPHPHPRRSHPPPIPPSQHRLHTQPSTISAISFNLSAPLPTPAIPTTPSTPSTLSTYLATYPPIPHRPVCGLRFAVRQRDKKRPHQLGRHTCMHACVESTVMR